LSFIFSISKFLDQFCRISTHRLFSTAKVRRFFESFVSQKASEVSLFATKMLFYIKLFVILPKKLTR